MEMNDQLLWGCIADDFTGASDAASFLVAGGLKTLLFNGLPSGVPDPGCQAVVIALKTRTQETACAVQDTLQAARWLKSHGAKQLYIKYCSTFDSTPRGNIGPILDALLEEYALPCTILCPALPVNGRQVIHGRLYVNGIPLDQSPMGQHPLTPMWDSRISVLMEAQSKYPCIHVDGSQYLLPGGQGDSRAKGHGRGLAPADQTPGTRGDSRTQGHGRGLALADQTFTAIEQFAAGHPHFYIIPDYARDEDASAIADLFGDLPLLSGGSGLLMELARRMSADVDKKPSPTRPCFHKEEPKTACPLPENRHGQQPLTMPCHHTEEEKAARQVWAGKDDRNGQKVHTRTTGSGLLLAGSCSEMTRRQIAYAQNHHIPSLQIVPQKLLDGSQTLEELWHFIRSHQGQEVLVYSSDSPENVKAVQKSGKERIAQLLEQTAAQLALKAVEEGYTRIIVAGGETSGAVTRALGFDSYIIGESVAPGVPVMIPQNRPEIRLVLKSGNFGQEDFFLRALEITSGQDPSFAAQGL